MKLVSKQSLGIQPVYDIEVKDDHNFYANGICVHNCATNGGVSVIHPSGDVYDITGQLEGTVSHVSFNGNGQLITEGDYSSRIAVYDTPTADIDHSAYNVEYLSKAYYSGNGVALLGGTGTEFAADFWQISNGDSIYIRNKKGLTHLKENPASPANGMVAYTTAQYCSGYMRGDIKGAWLADTTQETVGVDEGTELVTSWTNSSGTYETFTSSGKDVTSAIETGVSGFAVSNSMSLTVGNNYEIVVDITLNSGSAPRVSLGNASSALGGELGYTQLASGSNTLSFNFQTSGYNYLWLSNSSAGNWSATVSVKQTGNLVVNGAFDVNTSGWTAGNSATLSAPSGELIVTANVTDYPYAYQTLTLEVGKVYTISAYNSALSAGQARVRVSTGGNPINGDVINGTLLNAGNWHVYTFTATNATTHIALMSQTTGDSDTANWDNVVVRLADPDRSVNNDGLEVHGTLTKTAVSSGAELVSYSGFSANSYLQQPYNSALDFGTGDFYVMGWCSITNTGATRTLFSRANTSLTAPYFRVYFDSNGYIAFNTNDGTTNHTLNHSTVFDSDTKYKFYVFTKVNGVKSFYVDGVLINSATPATNNTLNKSDAVFTLGVYADKTLPLSGGSLALWRIGAGAPTAEQIQFIYEQEKPLFQQNSLCTLQSSSSDVKALAYDDTTDILTVCTADHVTKFNGLKVVDDEARVATSVSTTDGRELYGA